MDLDKYKWLKGTRKAFERVPYRLTGQRGVEDGDIAAWGKDLSAARGAFTLLEEYAKESKGSWKKLLEQNKNLLKSFRRLSEPMQAEGADAGASLIPEEPRHFREFEAVYANVQEAEAHVTARVDQFYAYFGARVHEAKETVSNLEKLIQKYSRKKLDYERLRAGAPDQGTSGEQPVQPVASPAADAERLYRQYRDHVKETIPRWLTQLDLFLTALAAKHAEFGSSLLKSWGEILQRAVAAFGPASAGVAETSYADTYKAWIAQFTSVQYQLESIPLLRDGTVTQQPMTSEKFDHDSEIAHGAKQLVSGTVHGTVHLATDAYGRITHIHVPNVAFHSHDRGIFGPTDGEKFAAASGASSPISSASAPSPALDEKGLPLATDSKRAASPAALAAAAAAAGAGASAGAAAAPARVTSPPLPQRTRGRAEYVVAKFEFVGDEGDISFKPGDRIRVLDHGAEGDRNWWAGEIDGRVGLFPADYVESADRAVAGEPAASSASVVSPPSYAEHSETPDEKASAVPGAVGVPNAVSLVHADHSAVQVKEHFGDSILEASPLSTVIEADPNHNAVSVEKNVLSEAAEQRVPDSVLKVDADHTNVPVHEPANDVAKGISSLTIDQPAPAVSSILPADAARAVETPPPAQQSVLPKSTAADDELL